MLRPFTALLLLALCLPAIAEQYQLQSPSGDLAITLDTDAGLRWSVSYKGETVIAPSEIGMELVEGGDITRDIQVKSHNRSQVDNWLEPVVALKSARVREHYHQLALRFDNGFGLDLRAYDDGVAYRFVSEREGKLRIKREQLALNFPDGASTLFPEEESLISHNERLYVPATIAEIDSDRFASLPVYMRSGNTHVVFTEADLLDYPGLFLYGTGDNTLRGSHPQVVTKATPMAGSEDRNQDITFGDIIADTEGERSFPWRLAIISDRDGALVESQLVWLLSSPNRVDNTEWIKPGKIAWDWYNANNLFGVDFEAGINTRTYKYYIDFAAQFGLEYVILDEGWTKTTTNILETNPDIDVHELIRYGKEKNVGIILWNLWGPLDKDYKNILKTYGEWGAAGIKVDFMQRSDQYMVNFYEKIAREAAKNQLMVSYHGGFKPTGLRRTYPNLVTHEGVKGNENNKWSSDITPDHNLNLPFIRMAAGPMDYTPGALRNAQPQNHHINHFRPMSIGTRAHEVAMYAVFESGFQMLCESPSTYLREPEVTAFMAAFPVTWDETRVLDARVGEYILIARRHGERWYLGAMTNSQERELTLNLDFLPSGKFTLDYLADGLNTENFAEDYRRDQRAIDKNDKLTLKLAAGGGWAGIISPQ